MTTKVFTNFRAPVNSYPLGEMNLGILAPGRYSGFDTMTGSSLSIKIEHSGRIKKSSVSTSGVISQIIFGALLMPNGCTIHNETAAGEGIDLVIDSNVGNANTRHDLVVCEHEYVQVEGGQPPIYFIQKGANDGLVPALAIPNKQVIIGTISIEPNGNTFASLTYNKAQVPIPGDNTDPEFIENIGINDLLDNFGLQEAINNDSQLTDNSNIGIADNKALLIGKPETQTPANWYGVFKFEHFASQAAGTLKAWLGIAQGTGSSTLLKFLVGGTVFEDAANTKGIAYANDYSASMDADDRMIPDAGWVKNQIPDVSNVIKTTVAYLDSFTLHRQHTVNTGLPDETNIIAVIPYIECKAPVFNYIVGDITQGSYPNVADSGGLGEAGLSVQFRQGLSSVVRVLIADSIYLNQGFVSNGSVQRTEFVIAANWKVRLVIIHT